MTPAPSPSPEEHGPRFVDGAAAPAKPNRDREAGLCVLYYCAKCDGVVPYWGALHGMQRRGAKWPKTIAPCRAEQKKGAAACAGQMQPREAYACDNLGMRTLLRLLRTGEHQAAALLLKGWREVKLTALTWREPVPGDPGAPPPGAAA